MAVVYVPVTSSLSLTLFRVYYYFVWPSQARPRVHSPKFSSVLFLRGPLKPGALLHLSISISIIIIIIIIIVVIIIIIPEE